MARIKNDGAELAGAIAFMTVLVSLIAAAFGALVTITCLTMMGV